MARSTAIVAAILSCSAAAVSAQDVNIPSDYPTIQEGIDVVGPGGTVFVDTGVYTESLIIDPLGALGPARGKTSMTIKSNSPGVVVQWAAGAHALPAAAATANGSPIDYVLLVKNGVDVDITGIEFAGVDDVTTGGGVRSGGIFYLQSSGTIADCTIHGFQVSPTDGTDAGLGVHVEGFGAVVELYNSTLYDIQKTCVTAQGLSTLNVNSCHLTGRGPTADLVQNGVQYGSGLAIETEAVGTIDNCTFGGFWYTGATDVSCGVLSWNAGAGITIENSTFNDCQAGVFENGNLSQIATTIQNNTFTQVTPWTAGAYPTGVIVDRGNTLGNYSITGNDFVDHSQGGITLFNRGGTITGNYFNGNGVDTGENGLDDTDTGINIWDGNRYSDFATNGGYGAGTYLVPGFAGAVDGNPVGKADTTVYALLNTLGSIMLLSGEPQIGTEIIIGVNNNHGTQSPGAFALLFFCAQPDPNYPNGTVLPGFAMDGTPGELAIDLNTEITSLTQTQLGWAGPEYPFRFYLDIPNEPAYVGLSLYSQGVMVDLSAGPPPPFGQRFALTRGLRVDLGY